VTTLTTHDPTTDTPSDLFERVRTLEFDRRYHDALTLLDTQPRLDARLEAARGVLLIFTGDLSGARLALTNALARGHRGALAGLATVQRLHGEPRDALLELRDADLEPLDDFDRANLERETGLLFEERGDLETARTWLECAWRTALISGFGRYQLAGIAQGLGRVLGRLGFDALGVAVLDEGLRHARADRRVPLLYERLVRTLHLGDAERAAQDLEELRVFVPDRPDLALLERYAEARLHLSEGNEAQARAAFELLVGFSDLHDTPVARDVRLHALLYLVKLETDAGGPHPERVGAWLKRLEGSPLPPREAALLELRRARWQSTQGRHAEAAQRLCGVIESLSRLGWRVEAGIARLHRAESLLRDGLDRVDEADAEIAAVIDTARVIGGTAPFALELRALTKVRTHLAREHGYPGGAALLEAGSGVSRVRVRGDRLEVNAVEVGVSVRAVRLAAYLARHPSSTWAHLRTAVFADLEEQSAFEAFRACRAELRGVNGVRLEYRADRHAYSLVWEGVSFEVC
jgi:tetratricopeptide (TPR) repeat protein